MLGRILCSIVVTFVFGCCNRPQIIVIREILPVEKEVDRPNLPPPYHPSQETVPVIRVDCVPLPQVDRTA